MIDYTGVVDALRVDRPYVSIYGQSAPYPGVTVRGAVFAIHTHDVLVQHMKFRVGDATEGVSGDSRDCVALVGPADDVVFDHNTFSWSVDELVGVTRTANGNYSFSTGSFSSGTFSVSLTERTNTVAETIEDEIVIIIELDTETIEVELSAQWRYVASEGQDEEQRAENIINWVAMFMVIFLPALLFAGGIYENNQQPDSMHISPIFGIIAGLCLSIGIGVYTSLVPLWMLILIIISIVVLIVGMVKH